LRAIFAFSRNFVLIFQKIWNFRAILGKKSYFQAKFFIRFYPIGLFFEDFKSFFIDLRRKYSDFLREKKFDASF